MVGSLLAKNSGGECTSKLYETGTDCEGSKYVQSITYLNF